jgi:hypothetical protein
MSNWTTRQKVGAVVGIAVHAVIVWQVWEMSKMTPRTVQFINCEGEVEFEGHYRPGETPPEKKEEPKGFSI